VCWWRCSYTIDCLFEAYKEETRLFPNVSTSPKLLNIIMTVPLAIVSASQFRIPCTPDKKKHGKKKNCRSRNFFAVETDLGAVVELVSKTLNPANSENKFLYL
jgi:hypothetical protein